MIVIETRSVVNKIRIPDTFIIQNGYTSNNHINIINNPNIILYNKDFLL